MSSVVTPESTAAELSAGRLTAVKVGATWPVEEFVDELVALSLRALRPMFTPSQGLHCFRSQRGPGELGYRGMSRRYTGMVLIGATRLADETARSLFGGQSPADVVGSMTDGLAEVTNLGDVAVIAWAAAAMGHDHTDEALRRLDEIWQASQDHPTVEIAWMLTALSTGAVPDSQWSRLAGPVQTRLREAYNAESGLFNHRPAWTRWPPHRAHVGCFADEIYPVLALARYHARYNEPSALDVAAATAERICRLQGEQGQWWWHYDVRTGDVLEGFPVYSVHQDAMAPMGLFELLEAGGPDYSREIRLGLEWLRNPHEMDVALVDHDAPAIWRKIGRAEPGKLVRSTRAVVSRAHARARLRWMDGLFPPGRVDYECRPYHLGWVLDAWARRQN